MSIKLQQLLVSLYEDSDVSDRLQSLYKRNYNLDLLSLNLVDKDLLHEVKTIVHGGNMAQMALYFGETLRDIKLVIQDDDGMREHEIFVQYKDQKKLIILSVNLPHSSLQDKEYKTIEEIAIAFRIYVNSLASYFYELERIDHFCTVMEPVNPSFKDDYRKILLDDLTWLHVEVTTAGLATNVHLVGPTDILHDRLQSGFFSWDHDMNIVDNIKNIFEITEFPVQSHGRPYEAGNCYPPKEAPTCGICLCDELPDDVRLPQPLCQNPNCGVYFHRNCLYQWLVACSGSRLPAFGVANGACPTCLQPIACSDKN